MQDAWTAHKAEEILEYAGRNEWEDVFAVITVVYGATIKVTAPLPSASGTIPLTEKAQILKRWARHFGSILNRPPPSP
nr:unnamed protein product [Spirometra erinaceieuropaei]